MESWNCRVVTTFTATVAGEMVTLMLFTGSVQVFVELLLAVVEVETVQVTAVLTGAAPQDARPKTAMNNTKNRRSFTAPLSCLFDIPNPCDCLTTPVPKI
jgi:hypothetical protein